MVNTLALLSLAAAASAAALPSSRQDISRQQLHKRADVPWAGPGGRVADPEGAAPRHVKLQSDLKLPVPGVHRLKIRYGPYSVPNMNTQAISGEYGALFNFPDVEVEKPCEECTIVKMQAGLEYPNATDANIDSGMWLHHMVALSVDKDRWDATCHEPAESLPHVLVGTDAKVSERFLSSGNERVPILLFQNEAKPAGYHLKKTDQLKLIVDLMNMNMDDRTVYLTITWDMLDGPLPQGWNDIKPVWLDVDQCGQSEVDPPVETGIFAIESKPWTPNFEGEVYSLTGHLHDGGSHIEIFAAPNKTICDSVAKYAESDKYIFKDAQKSAAMGGDIVAENHISSMSSCQQTNGFTSPGVKKVTKDQSWVLKGNYNYDKFDGNKDKKGRQQHIMAISIVYVAVAPGSAVRA